MGDKIDRRTKVLVKGLGEDLRRLREDLGLAQKDLAQKIGMEPTNLAKIERGAKNVTVDTLRRIADGLELDVVVKFALRSEHPSAQRTRAPDVGAKEGQ